jgi:hypothetical protein
MYKNLISATCVLFVLLLLSCCKDDPEDSRPKCQTVTHAPQEFLDYWFFPRGSWWVYKLKGSSPAVFDTVTNTGRLEAFYAEPDEDSGLAAPCEMFYVNDLLHSNRTYFAGPSPDQKGAEAITGYRFGNKWIISQSWIALGHGSEGYVFFYPFSIGEELGPSENRVVDTNAVVTPTYTFHNSVGMYGGNPDTSASPRRKVYFTKGVGITYRRYFNGEVWELINYHINR